MKDYELMYIVPTSFTEEELGAVEKNVTRILEKNSATITKTTRLGKFRFTYTIGKENHGHYVLVRFQCEAANVHGINEGLRMNQKEVLRHLIVDASDVNEEFSLVQFQEVAVDGGDRRRRTPKEDKPEGSEDVDKTQKEGVAALEGDDKADKEPVVLKASIETL